MFSIASSLSIYGKKKDSWNSGKELPFLKNVLDRNSIPSPTLQIILARRSFFSVIKHYYVQCSSFHSGWIHGLCPSACKNTGHRHKSQSLRSTGQLSDTFYLEEFPMNLYFLDLPHPPHTLFPVFNQ